MAIKLPTRQGRLPIVDSKGVPTSDFLRFLNLELIGKIELALNQTNQALADLELVVQQIKATMQATQAAQQSANLAQETADAAGGTATSGSASNPFVDISSTGPWVSGPQVDLTGVVAGTLTISGTGPQQDEDVELFGPSFLGEFRVQEIVSGVETTLFTGTFNASVPSGTSTTIVTNLSAAAVQSFSAARTSTGAVSYRVDARRTNGSGLLTSLLLYIYARRTT